ncbi:pseudouridine synthase [Xylaria nigripes]|nr:pseudouridine synthase [Xylaria nigripes]
MAKDTDPVNQPSRNAIPATAAPSADPNSNSTTATPRDPDACDQSNASDSKQDEQPADTKKADRGRGRKRRNEFGRKDKKASEKGPQIDWRDRKRRKVNQDGEDGTKPEPSYMSIQFPKAEIAAEERRPKRKVAVLIGYAGTGYHGLQINHNQKTIEGDLFAALVAAKAISKANADDPRKSSFVRCARTDKGVHAAGNMVSLKLIIEDPDLLQKVNENLPPQIRVWSIERTMNSFSCYTACDSRWYEYLMPSYCLLPPHPESYLGRNVLQSIKEKGLEDYYAERMGEVKDYWAEVDKNYIQPILDRLEPSVREAVNQHIHISDWDLERALNLEAGATEKIKEKPSGEATGETVATGTETMNISAGDAEAPADSEVNGIEGSSDPDSTTVLADPQPEGQRKTRDPNPVEQALKEIKTAYVAAKRRYRITPDRLEQLQGALDKYVGTKNFHNYTIQKAHSDPASKRTIRSFVVNPEPIQINDTQWLSLKVHGQSFMMHQIRKMVGMAALVTRCATPWERFDESYSEARISIPKAPSLGLLLESPVFTNYNKRASDIANLKGLDFANHEKEIKAFKEEYIYRHIFELEEQENSFHTFFNQIDTFRSDYFLWVTAGGLEAARKRVGPREDVPQELEAELGDEGDEGDEVGGEEG